MFQTCQNDRIGFCMDLNGVSLPAPKPRGKAAHPCGPFKDVADERTSGEPDILPQFLPPKKANDFFCLDFWN
jgi:hypothetical protein